MFGLPFSEVWAPRLRVRLGVGGPALAGVPGRKRADLWSLDPVVAGRSRGRPPFRTDPDVLFVAYYAPAELSCFLALGWPLPARILDLYIEFRAETNGLTLPIGRGLLGALSHHGIPSITSDEKKSMRDLVLRGGPWTESERRDILDYCATDVDCLAPLLERMLPGIRRTSQGFGQALLRGRYTAAVARMEHTGIPIDVPTIELLRRHWGDIKLGLIADIDKDYGVLRGHHVQGRPVRVVARRRGNRVAANHHRPAAARSGHLPRHGEDLPEAGPPQGTSPRAQ